MSSASLGVVVIVILMVPGVLYETAIERLVGFWRTSLADRTLRFLAASAVFHALMAPITFELWSRYVRSGRLDVDDAIGLQLWAVPVAYVMVPFAFGGLVGLGTQRRWRWARAFTGRDPEPTAWDHLFSQPDRQGWIRCKLKSGVWIGGAFAAARRGSTRSYASSHPHPQDLYIARRARVNATTGEFDRDGNERVILEEWGLLVRWDEIEFLEFNGAD